jgi:hypothetical protein
MEKNNDENLSNRDQTNKEKLKKKEPQKTEVKNFCLLSRRICAKKEKYYVASFS